MAADDGQSGHAVDGRETLRGRWHVGVCVGAEAVQASPGDANTGDPPRSPQTWPSANTILLTRL